MYEWQYIIYLQAMMRMHCERSRGLVRWSGGQFFYLFRFESQSVDGAALNKLYQEVDSSRCVVYSAGLYARQQNPSLGRFSVALTLIG